MWTLTMGSGIEPPLTSAHLSPTSVQKEMNEWSNPLAFAKNLL